MSEELKPCPFCGKAPTVTKKGNSVAHWEVECKACRVHVVGTHEDDAVKTWNTRPFEDELIALLRECAGTLLYCHNYVPTYAMERVNNLDNRVRAKVGQP